MRKAPWGPGGGRRELPPPPRCRTSPRRHQHPPALPSAERRERGDLVAEQSLLPMRGGAPPVYGCYFIYGSRARVTIYI